MPVNVTLTDKKVTNRTQGLSAMDDKEGFIKKSCRACTDFKKYFSQGRERYKNSPTSNETTNPPLGTTSEADRTTPPDSTTAPECPPDAWELGRSSWTLLHSMAAYYPDTPSEEEQREVRSFMTAFARLYPCQVCAEDLRENLKTNQPDVSSRDALSQWMCLLHNDVNRKLGKPEFDCRRVDERWRDGWKDGSCD